MIEFDFDQNHILKLLSNRAKQMKKLKFGKVAEADKQIEDYISQHQKLRRPESAFITFENPVSVNLALRISKNENDQKFLVDDAAYPTNIRW